MIECMLFPDSDDVLYLLRFYALNNSQSILVRIVGCCSVVLLGIFYIFLPMLAGEKRFEVRL